MRLIYKFLIFYAFGFKNDFIYLFVFFSFKKSVNYVGYKDKKYFNVIPPKCWQLQLLGSFAIKINRFSKSFLSLQSAVSFLLN